MSAMFWERFTQLCNERGEKPTPIVKKLGLASGSITRWKNGSNPNAESLKAIADYFGVSASFLLGQDYADLDPATKRLLELFAKVPQDKKEALIQLIESTLKMQGLI